MPKESTKKQLNNLIEFRQVIYEKGLTRARDAQFELIDALLMSRYVRSFPELTLSPVFRRAWPSAYAAIEEGKQDREWLEEHFVAQVPREGQQVFALDDTAWPHTAARTLADRQYIRGCTHAINESIVIGHPYSVLVWVPDAHLPTLRSARAS